jgi:hypothetical protein
VREIRLHGSEGGAVQANVPFLPLSVAVKISYEDGLNYSLDRFKFRRAIFWCMPAFEF